MVPNLIAGGTIAVSTFVKVSSAASNTALQAGAGDFPIGISQEFYGQAPIPNSLTSAATVGQPIKIYGLGDICLLQSSSSGWIQSDLLKSDASGNGVAASSTDNFGAIALETVTGAGLGRVQIVLGTKK